MTSSQTLFVLLFTILALCQAFVPNEIQSRGASRSTGSTAQRSSPTELYMGFFDKKPAKKGPEKKGDASFLDGRGAKITIRQDEDNAMWVEEPKKPAPKTKGKK